MILFISWMLLLYHPATEVEGFLSLLRAYLVLSGEYC
jgi:hypothetical protein